MKRLPKKLKKSILENITTGELRAGWGIQIDEGPDFSMISAFALCGLIAWGVISLLWAILQKDPHAGLAIGSYLTSVQTAWMATMYFRWR